MIMDEQWFEANEGKSQHQNPRSIPSGLIPTQL